MFTSELLYLTSLIFVYGLIHVTLFPSFQPKIGFKTRYGMVANPFATSNADGAIAFAKKNIYYRLSKVANLM